MKARAWILAMAVSFVFTGCSSQIVMHNEKTGQTAQCYADTNSWLNPSSATEACAKGYEAAGYKRVSQY